ncbi:MAG: DUF3463 domain-containing protein, partial [Gammaproteobacteria bacterium]
YASSFESLMEDTDWSKYGTGVNPKCANCMMHCGYEMTAVEDTFRHPIKAAKVALYGPRLDGPLAPEVPFVYDEPAVTKPQLSASQAAPVAACNKQRVA